MILRHPDRGYVFGRKVGVASCINAGKEIPIIFIKDHLVNVGCKVNFVIVHGL